MKPISTNVHGILDYLSGALLIASPWVFGFADRVYLPQLILGLMEIGASLLTQRTPAYDRSTTANGQV